MRLSLMVLLWGCARETGLAPIVDRDGDPAERPDLDDDGFAAFDGDCDDADPAINPAAAEVCGDGIDNNCDGSANGCRLAGAITSTAASHAMFVGDRLAGRGGATMALGDATGDGVIDLLVSDPYRGVADRDQSGAAHLFYGPFSGTKLYSQAQGHWNGALPDRIVGKTVTLADVNADGVQDVLVGHDNYTTLWLCPCSGGYDLQVDRPYKSWDAAITLVGDVDGDGVDEYLLGDQEIRDLATDTVDATLPAGFTYLRTSFNAPTDLNGDGIHDLVLTRLVRVSPDDPRSLQQVALLRGPITGEVPFADLQLTPPLGIGELPAPPGVADIDRDGETDLSVNNQILAGPDFVEVLAEIEPWIDGGCTPTEVPSEDGKTCSIYLVGDIDGDGHEDAVLHEQEPATIEARAALVYGPLAGTIRAESAQAVLESDDRLPRLFPGPSLPPYLVFYDWLADGPERASGVVWIFRPGW